MKNIKLKLAYQGTNYYGFSKQVGVPTVESFLEEAIFKFTGERTKIYVASRTDRGVHAVGQVVNFFSSSPIKADNFKRALNNFLPADIQVISSEETDADFNARFSAKSREYLYNIYLGKPMPLCYNSFFWKINYLLDLELMQRGMSFFRGEKDFSRFTNAKQISNVRTVIKFEMETKPATDYLALSENDGADAGKVLQFIISANSFLYHMVRNIIGTLIDLGRGRISLSYIENIFFGVNGNYPHTIAAPSGLCLREVGY